MISAYLEAPSLDTPQANSFVIVFCISAISIAFDVPILLNIRLTASYILASSSLDDVSPQCWASTPYPKLLSKASIRSDIVTSLLSNTCFLIAYIESPLSATPNACGPVKL